MQGSVTTKPTVVPLISSGTAGPLGAIHLPRLWAKLTLANANQLPEGYDSCGAGFDQMTIDGLGLTRDAVIAFIRDRKPTYVQFETYVRENGDVSPATIEKHNAAIRGYNHSDELAGKMRAASGLQDESIRDAVTLNMLEDLDELHTVVTK